MTQQAKHNDAITYDKDDRGVINAYPKISRFRVGDKVYLSIPPNVKGPYLVATVPTPGRYTICLEKGQPVNGGEEVAEYDLIKVT